MTRVAIVEGVRTPFVKAGSLLRDYSAQELGRLAVRELIERTELDPTSVDELILGNVAQPMDATNIARVVALQSGLPLSISAYTVARNCASGMQSIADGYELIRNGQAHVVIVGGTESMSNIPLLFPKEMSLFLEGLWKAKSPLSKLGALLRFRPSMLRPVLALVEGLKDPFCGLSMGQTAEVLAKEFQIRREEQDAFALESHRRAIEATNAKIFEDEILPLYLPHQKQPLEKDIGPRENQTMEALAKLSPYFDRKYGTVTVGNSCPITDGACAILLMSEAKVRVSGAKPLAWIRSYGFAGLDPRRMGLGPAVATPIALRKAGLHMRDMKLVEINEAFAAQVLAVLRIFEDPKKGEYIGAHAPELSAVSWDQLNVNGGAIAMGHPVGTSGARITLTLAKELKRRALTFGLATMCVGGGQGGAIVLENAQ